MAAALITPINTEHFSAQLPGKWRAHPIEKSGVVEMGSYEQQDGPGFLTTSVMAFRADAAQDREARRAALQNIVNLRRKAIVELSHGDATFGPDEVDENRWGYPSISSSYVDRRSGIVGRFCALLTAKKIIGFMYYEHSTVLETAVRDRAELILKQVRVVP